MLGLNGIQINEKAGDLDIVYSGTIFSYDEDHPAIISINNLLTITIGFKQDPENSGSKINFNGSGQHMNITCYNFSNILGDGTNPVMIGNLSQRELWISFVVISLSPTSHLLHYTLYYGKTVEQKK